MAHLATSRGVNLLVTQLDRRQQNRPQDRGQVHGLVVEVDQRDQNSRDVLTAMDPHLMETAGGSSSPVSTYGHGDVEDIGRAAGQDGSFELRDAGGQRVGMMYAVKADVTLVPQAAGFDTAALNQRLDPQTLRPSDFDGGLGTRRKQYEGARRVHQMGRTDMTAIRQWHGDQQLDVSRLSMDDQRAMYATTLSPDERSAGVGPVALQTVGLQRQRAETQRRLMPDLDHSRPAAGFEDRYSSSARSEPAPQKTSPDFGEAQQPPRQRGAADGGLLDPQRFEAERTGRDSGQPGVSSQAGLAAMRGSQRSVPSSPAPGEPGSRFNPNVRERPDMGTTVPARPQGHIAGPDSTAPDPAPKQKRRMPTAEEISAAGRIGRSGAAGAAAGLKLGSAVPHPAGRVVGVVGGAVVGGAKGLVGEADQRVEARRKAEEKEIGQQTGTGGAQTGDKTASNSLPDVKRWLPAWMREPCATGRRGTGADRSEPSRFETGRTTSSEPEMGG